MKSSSSSAVSSSAMRKGLTATRFVQKPLKQPSYSFRDVPRCKKDLESSSLQKVIERDHWKESMAEMVLLCNEAMRRQKHTKKTAAKPLSLEYIVDRLDVDDPLSGYFVRTPQGMLQGFITVTTFTNWQKSFHWDSRHESAFAYDDEEMAGSMQSGERAFDADGTLADDLQATVRCGDPWNEGIVWPRLAEISLLGGLGCGKALLSLVIEDLECQKPTEKANYDYVVLQATDNSIPFYESMGFVRVGAVTEDEKAPKQPAATVSTSSSSDSDGEAVAVALEPSSPLQPDGLATHPDIVTSPVAVFNTSKPGQTPTEVARQLKIDVWDIIFLNHDLYPGIAPTSRLKKQTPLYVPATPKESQETKSGQDSSMPKWYIAKENDTPRMIARMFEASCKDMVEANRERLPDLQANSRLKAGTRIKVSHFDVPDDFYVPYCHWTFPDATFESGEPSYMMVRKLNRRKGAAAKQRPFLESLAVPISDFVPTPLLLPASPVKNPRTGTANGESTPKPKKHPEEPKPPKRPPNAFFIFSMGQRERLRNEMPGKPASELTKAISSAWKALPENEKARFHLAAEKASAEYQKAKACYDTEMKRFLEANPGYASSVRPKEKTQTLFNKVVKLRADALVDHSEYKYWYVLTFIPDLKWCHLAPMVQDGTFGPDKPTATGRPRWKLEDESLGKEIDVSSRFCIPLKSKAMRKTQDADLEEWDIIESDSLEVPIVAEGTPDPMTASPALESSSSCAAPACAPKKVPKKPRLAKQPKNPRKGQQKQDRPAIKKQKPAKKAETPGPKASLADNVSAASKSANPGNNAKAQKNPMKSPQKQEELPAAKKRKAEAPVAETTGSVSAPTKDASSTSKAETQSAQHRATGRKKRSRSPGSGESPTRKKASPTNEVFEKGALVSVEAHSWPGVNCQGGIGRVVSSRVDEDGDLLYSVKYVVGKTDKNIEARYVQSFSF